MLVTGFSDSFVRWSIAADPTDNRSPGHMPWGNSVRIQIDASCRVIESTGATTDLYLIAPCRKEWMYRQTGLIMNPGAEYRAVFSADRQIDAAMQARLEGDRPLPASTDAFTDLQFEISSVLAKPLMTDREVVEAAQGGEVLVARTYLDGPRGSSATLEYPVRTMNFHPERGRFQVDTGPLILPLLHELTGHPIECCRLAHTVYNTLDYAEFTARPAGDAFAAESGGVGFRAYSELHTLACRHEFFAIPVPASSAP